MTDLSPAAQAVLDAWWNSANGEYVDGVWTPNRSVQLAAALRAAADQVVPEPDDWDKDNFSIQALRLRCVMRDQLLAISAELDGTNPTNQEDYEV